MLLRALALLILCSASAPLWAADPIPHAQDKPPGPALSPQEAIAKMVVPAGFTVELVASEPELVNPVAMTIDERGRFWVTESLEYPRKQPGPGQDRVRVLEDKDGDGKVETFTTFMEGLNIPSGIAVGYGGVWVANAPDILFVQDTDGDGKADKQEVVVSGFGRFDTHELPNSLTWGPDGWLYGLNGVFNQSDVKYGENNPNYSKEHPGWKFTCALFRIHPISRKFEIWCEGTSNPWGLTIDGEGSFFISACVIDHLWHLTETGYYHRQGGPYPPFVWKLDSIVKHKHQKAAYCGLHYYDSDAYPEQYRGKFYMGNLHGSAINSDKVVRQGATYFGTPEPDFLSANDAWFMPVVQKTGPDGCLYILDWYDRYHCYQDANRDPKGIDRLKGRLYRVRYKDTPRAKSFDLTNSNNGELILLLGSGNGLIRDLAQRLLTERLTSGGFGSESVLKELAAATFAESKSQHSRMHALFTLVSSGKMNDALLLRLLDSGDPVLRAWGVRAAGNAGKVADPIREKIVSLAKDPAPTVQVQVAIAAKKIAGIDALPLLVAVAANCGEDKLIPNIVWQNLHPLLEKEGPRFLEEVKKHDLAKSPALKAILPRAAERLAAKK